jgi:hypothetical protein
MNNILVNEMFSFIHRIVKSIFNLKRRCFIDAYKERFFNQKVAYTAILLTGHEEFI